MLKQNMKKYFSGNFLLAKTLIVNKVNKGGEKLHHYPNGITMYVCAHFLTQVPFDVKKNCFSHSTVPFQNLSFATLVCGNDATDEM